MSHDRLKSQIQRFWCLSHEPSLREDIQKNCRKSVIGIIYPYESEKFAQVYCNTFVVTFQCSDISLTLYESKQDETKHDKSNTKCK